MFRLGRAGDILHWGQDGSCPLDERAENMLVLGVVTSTSYIYIVLVLMVGFAFGDSGRYVVTVYTLT